MGGDECKAAGMKLFLHQKEMAFMGFLEVAQNLRTIKKNLKAIKQDILEFEPDLILLVDYPGFNLRIAQFCKKHGIPVNYYIAPKVWAWKENRVKKIKEYVDQLFSILPFEEEYFKAHDVKSIYVGNPSKVKVDRYIAHKKVDKEQIIALIPGSRTQEIKTSLPIMLKLRDQFPTYKFIISQAPGFDSSFYKGFTEDVELEPDMYKLLSKSELALVTSGTATLETALFGVPQIVCYKTSKLTYWIARSLVKLKYISLVNLLLDRPVVTELIQEDFNSEKLLELMQSLLNEQENRDAMFRDYTLLREHLGKDDPAKVITTHILDK